MSLNPRPTNDKGGSADRRHFLTPPDHQDQRPMSRIFVAGAIATFSVSIASGVCAAGPNDADRAFLAKDVQGARFELALARAAQTKASTPQVRSYARMIVHDHTQANSALMQLAKEEGVQAPAGLTPKDAQTLSKLTGLAGRDFDRSYLDEVTRINAQDETDADHERSSTKDQRISNYLRKFSAMDAKHKTLGESLKRANA